KLLSEYAQQREYKAMAERITSATANGASPAELARIKAEAEALIQAVTLDARAGRGLTFIGAGDFIARAYPEPVPPLEGILSAAGGGWLGGEEKTGKTWWALEETVSLVLGVKVAGYFNVPQSRRVLILEEEDSPRRTQRRLRAILRGKG